MWSRGTARDACHSSSQLQMNIHVEEGASVESISFFFLVQKKPKNQKTNNNKKIMCTCVCARWFTATYNHRFLLPRWLPAGLRRSWRQVSHAASAHKWKKTAPAHMRASCQRSTDALAVAARQSAQIERWCEVRGARGWGGGVHGRCTVTVWGPDWPLTSRATAGASFPNLTLCKLSPQRTGGCDFSPVVPAATTLAALWHCGPRT